MKQTIWIGADHAGVELKQEIKKVIESEYVVQDVGPQTTESVDYPDFAEKVAREVAKDPKAQGILICGSGMGMCITANKIPGIRAAVVHSLETAALARQHGNANILCLGARISQPSLAAQMVKTWLTSEFEGGRHQRRIDKIAQLEKKS